MVEWKTCHCMCNLSFHDFVYTQNFVVVLFNFLSAPMMRADGHR